MWSVIASIAQFGLRLNQHRFQLGLDNKEALRFGNREMNRLPKFKSVSGNMRLTDSKLNLTAKVYSDSTKTVIKKAAYVAKRGKNLKL
jgi:hypothetical protein